MTETNSFSPRIYTAFRLISDVLGSKNDWYYQFHRSRLNRFIDLQHTRFSEDEKKHIDAMFDILDREEN